MRSVLSLPPSFVASPRNALWFFLGLGGAFIYAITISGTMKMLPAVPVRVALIVKATLLDEGCVMVVSDKRVHVLTETAAVVMEARVEAAVLISSIVQKFDPSFAV